MKSFFVAATVAVALTAGCAAQAPPAPASASATSDKSRHEETAGSGASAARPALRPAALGRAADAAELSRRSDPKFDGRVQPIARPVALAYAPTGARLRLVTRTESQSAGEAPKSFAAEGYIEAQRSGRNVAVELALEKVVQDGEPLQGWTVGFVLTPAGDVLKIDLRDEPGKVRTVQERLALRDEREKWISVVFSPFRAAQYRQGDLVQALAIADAEGPLGKIEAKLIGSTLHEGRAAYVVATAEAASAQGSGATLVYENRGYWLIDKETGLPSLGESVQRIFDRASGAIRHQAYQINRIEFR